MVFEKLAILCDEPWSLPLCFLTGSCMHFNEAQLNMMWHMQQLHGVELILVEHHLCRIDAAGQIAVSVGAFAGVDGTGINAACVFGHGTKCRPLGAELVESLQALQMILPASARRSLVAVGEKDLRQRLTKDNVLEQETSIHIAREAFFTCPARSIVCLAVPLLEFFTQERRQQVEDAEVLARGRCHRHEWQHR